MLLAVLWLFALLATAQAEDQTYQQASIDFMKIYFQRWSSTNSDALAYMNDVFPDEVTYFDKTLSHANLMNAKRHFAERWPERNFSERANSLNVICNEQHLCTVWGLVDWSCRSQQRHETVSGTSVFSFQLQDGQAVVAEDGFVVTRGLTMARRTPDATTEAVITPPPPASDKPAASSPPPAAQDTKPPAIDSRPGNYGNADIPGLRTAYFAQSSDRDWIRNWLMARKTFDGKARSLGPDGAQTLSDPSHDEVHVMQFDTDQGPIACMLADNPPSIAKGSDVQIHGVVSIFIDRTMYLTRCSFG